MIEITEDNVGKQILLLGNEAITRGALEAGVDVAGVISLTNRMEKRDDGKSVKEAVEEKGVKFYCMSSALELLPIMYKKLQPSEEVGKAIEAEFGEYGVEPLKVL